MADNSDESVRVLLCNFHKLSVEDQVKAVTNLQATSRNDVKNQLQRFKPRAKKKGGKTASRKREQKVKADQIKGESTGVYVKLRKSVEKEKLDELQGQRVAIGATGVFALF